MEKNADWDSFDPGFFLEMRSHIHIDKNSVNANIWATRNFFQFLIRQGLMKENPLQDIPLLKKNAIVPFIFSPIKPTSYSRPSAKGYGKQNVFFSGTWLSIRSFSCWLDAA
ncbi:MAG: hypothetical protein U5R49_08670 [Deltaproteobacteria bacterium]|nr:hypothetical protein [Deltaproteobacteria bacterium]